MEWACIAVLTILLGLGFNARNRSIRKTRNQNVAICKYCGIDTELKNLLVPSRCPTCGVLWKIKNRVVNVMFR